MPVSKQFLKSQNFALSLRDIECSKHKVIVTVLNSSLVRVYVLPFLIVSISAVYENAQLKITRVNFGRLR
jgi:hypothetical protein